MKFITFVLLNTFWHERCASMSPFFHIERYCLELWLKKNSIIRAHTWRHTINTFSYWWVWQGNKNIKKQIPESAHFHTFEMEKLIFIFAFVFANHMIFCELPTRINFYKLNFDLCRQDWKYKCIEMFWLIEKSHRNPFCWQ